MEYSKLLAVKKDKSLELNHFPSRFHAAVFRLWEMVPSKRIAAALDIDEELIKKAASEMGLPEQKCSPDWMAKGYITIIRSAWHILPYDQLLAILDWTEDELALVLKEDDFLDYKLGMFKPYCEKVVYEELDGAGKEKLNNIKALMQKNFSNLFEGAKPFDFFNNGFKADASIQTDDLRLIYSYCGLYAGVLENDVEMSFPEEMLKMYQASGVNAVWLPVVLYQMVPFLFDESYSKGYEKRQERLRKLIDMAAKYGIKVYLYLNEPRCMPIQFFENHKELQGTTMEFYAALCTQNKEVIEYLRYAVRTLCESVPGLGGFFAITCSENMTHCKSRGEGTPCPRCKDVPVYKLVSEILCAISEESRKVDPNIRTIAWTWSWDMYMPDDIEKCIDLLPKEIIIQCNSEAKMPFTIGGISGEIIDYSMSIPGPAPLAKHTWEYAKSKGHEVCAKVAVNDTWECSTVPYLPVFDLIREHMTGLKECGVRHAMLSWTLGGYPSINLNIASSCLEDPDEQRYDEILKKEYGDYAGMVKKAATLFSEAFREFPFAVGTLYRGPQNAGPSNLLYPKPTGFDATMTCYAYDDLDKWRSIYPRDIFISQLKKLTDIWKKGLDVIESMPDCEFKQMAWGGYALFYSSYLQSEFVDKRESGDKEHLLWIVQEEKKIANIMYELMHKNNLFGYEAANHYYFSKGMMIEKVINCEYIESLLR